MTKHPPRVSNSALLNRRTVIGGAATLIGALASRSTNAQAAWPQRPVRIIVPFAAGGNIDATARVTAAKLTEAIGSSFIVENRTGGSGVIATEGVARAQPDGYTLIWGGTNVMAILPNTTKVSFDPIKDFAPISLLGSNPQVLVINAKIPATNVSDFVAWAKAQPERITYGSGGPGSAGNLIMALFLKRVGLEMTNVNYRGSAPALADVMAGHIASTFVPMSEAYAQVGNANVRILAVSSGTRSRRMPDVPAVAETYPGYHAVSWFGPLAPAGTPRPIIDRIASEMIKAGKDQKFVEQLDNNGVDFLAEGPEKFATMIAAELATWGEAVKLAGLTPQP